MGIHNLLPFVKNACRQGNVSEFSGCSVAVDVSCLLHRGLFGCAESAAQEKKTTFYIHYVNKHIKALLELGCHVIMVFDGRPPPAKKNINDERRQRRFDNVKAGELLLSEGKIDEAVDKFKRATTITSDIVEDTISHFRGKPKVDVIVSPYESDAQLTFLVREGFADIVITEDSDLIVFGCEKIAFKWNYESGECMVYERNLLPQCFSGIMRNQFDFTKFRRICILSGCDYLQAGLPGIGLNKALSFFSKTSRTDAREILPRIPRYLNMPRLKVSKEFIDDFIRAENTFIHQVVFDPRQRCQRPLTNYLCSPKDGGSENKGIASASDEHSLLMDYSYAGEVISSKLAVRLALGNQIENSVLTDKFFLPSPVPEWSIWFDRYESCGERKRRAEKERKEKAKRCGAVFQFDSPSKKRVKMKPAESSECIDLESGNEHSDCSIHALDEEQNDNPGNTSAIGKSSLDSENIENLSEERENLSANSSKSVSYSKSIKNQACDSWTVEKLMRAYASKPDTSYAKDLDETPILGRSAYFVRRSAKCANPFRRPEIKKTDIADSSNSDGKPEVISDSPDSSIVEDDCDTNPLLISSAMKIIGCRPSGLRGSLK
ncbi:hypothetical protein KIN20_001190 [Parelaphostrongylus tenuis]|uniref:Exonuclease 1 n=1 Tax=Parelaphostrongylus tenuis TaxID=148309 RepID=A0AAD5LTB0_PARTN|nr:hypothetical protein KIN20_001190 [Parelaphostrongylus tenuis]